MATPPAAAIGAGNAIVGLCLKLCRATHSVKYQPSSLAPSTAYDRPNIEKQPFFFAVSFYLLAVLTEALGEIADAVVDRLLRLDQTFLGVRLVVERNYLDLLAQNAALGI
jgi:hypothetical protein